jgi:hypothetical protein
MASSQSAGNTAILLTGAEDCGALAASQQAHFSYFWASMKELS